MAKHRDQELISLARTEIGAWRPQSGPDFRDLIARSGEAWRRPVAAAAALGAAGLALMLALGLMLVLLGPLLPGTEALRQHLIAR